MIKKYPPIVQVDSFGNIIGPIDYKIAHARNGEKLGKRHLSANTFVFKSNFYKEILITQRGNIDRSGKLNVCVGGHAIWIESENRNQSPLENALSEISEEIFYELMMPNDMRIKKITAFKKDLRLEDPEYVHLFSCVYPGPFSINHEEVSEIFFMEINELKKDLKKNKNKYTMSAELYLDKLINSKQYKLL